jgi:hypothetical protein
MRSLFALALLLATTTTAHAQAPWDAPSDSALAASGCVRTAPGPDARRLVLDSAGVRVWESVTGFSGWWCPSGYVTLARGADTVILDHGRPFRRVGDDWLVQYLVDRPAERDAPYDSARTAGINRTYPSWRAALPALFAPGAVVVVPPTPGPVLPPPVVTPGPTPAPLTCEGHPVGFRLVGARGDVRSERTERTTLTRGDRCLGVTTLASATRYAAHLRTATGWRTLPGTFTSRAAAEAAVVSGSR